MPDAYRKMWLLLMYDLPVVEPEQRRRATRFHQSVVDQGFQRLHYSVYMRYCGSTERVDTVERAVRRDLPEEGSVVMLRLTDRQMANMQRWSSFRREEPLLPPPQYVLF
jgi:CRISPR-associated protein Cas2